jgi:phage terminase large subunit
MKREDIVRNALWRVEITDNIPLKDGIEAVRFILDKAWFELETTDDIRTCLMGYHEEFDKRKGMFKNWPDHDEYSHGADAFRYLAVTYKKITQTQNMDMTPVIAEY